MDPQAKLKALQSCLQAMQPLDHESRLEVCRALGHALDAEKHTPGALDLLVKGAAQ